MKPLFRLALVSLALVFSLDVQAQELRGIVPVAGSTAGGFGGNFRTELQLTNPTAQTLSGTIVFHPAGQTGSASDPSIAYQLLPHETRHFADIVGAMGREGLGSLDIRSDGPLPGVVARAFQDDGANGTKGVTLPVLQPDEVPGLQQIFVLIAPRDFTRFRFNIGIRSLSAGARLGITVYRKDGTVAGTAERTYAADFFNQQPANDVVGLTLQPSDSISFKVLEGSAIVYGTTTDNLTNDPSFQWDDRFNSNPVFDPVPNVQTSAGRATSVTISATDADGDVMQFRIINPPGQGTIGPLTVAGGAATFVFTPAAGFVGGDKVTIEVDDGNGGTNQIDVALNVGANQSPSATPGNVTTNEDQRVVITLRGADPELGPLTFTITVNPLHGTLTTITPTSANVAVVSYTPHRNFNGTDRFTFTVTDSSGASHSAVVNITVNPVNDDPLASPDNYTTNEDVTLNVPAPGVLSNDVDVDGHAMTASQVTGTTSGSLTINPNGSFTYVPNGQFFGTDSFTYFVTDSTGANSATVTVSLTINSVNDAPSFTIGPNQTVAEDAGPQTVSPWITVFSAGPANESTQTTSFEIVAMAGTNPALFAVAPSIAPDGTLSYTPAANESGVANISVRIVDNGGTANGGVDASAAQTFTITVTSVNDLPVANADSYSTDEDVTLIVPAPGVLANDTDGEGSALNAVLVTGPSNALTFALNSDGSFSYTPAANFNGSDSFTYHANDGTGNSADVTVTITVNALNDAPVAVNDAYGVLAGQTLNVPAPGVLANDTDAEGGMTAVLVSGPTFASSFTLNADGSFTYTNNGNPATTDSFTYRANDGTADSSIATVTITVTHNAAPVGVNDAYSVDEGATLNVVAPGVLGNDTDAESNPMTAVLVSGPANASSFALNADGSFSYTHNGSETTTDSFTYTPSDSVVGPGNVTTVTITINPINDAPVANNDAYSTDEDTPLLVPAPGVLLNDTDAENDPLTAILVTPPSNGTLFRTDDPVFVGTTFSNFRYVPNGEFFGTDSFTYRANDGSLDSNVATVTITVNPINDDPVATDDSYNVLANGTLNVPAPGVLANDTDVEGPMTAVLVSGPAHHVGTFTLNANGSFTYINNGNPATSDTFTYQVSDGVATSNIATVTITVTHNAAPVGVNDAYSVDEGATLNVAAPGVLGNDTDAESNPMTAVLVSGPTNASSFVLNPDGSFDYTHNGSETTSDSFTYTPSDAIAGAGNVTTVTITINPINDAPVAVNDSHSVTEDSPLNVAAPGVLGNDTDAELNSLTAILDVGPTNALSFTLNANGSFDYVPANNFVGTDSFTYHANDGTSDSNIATVTITVNPANDTPVANDDSYNMLVSGTLNIPAPGVLANDTDVEGPLSAILVTGPAHHVGTFTLNADGSFTYINDGDAATSDTFTYQAFDGTTNSNIATVTITVMHNSPPVGVNDAYAVDEGATLNVPALTGVLNNDTDPDGDPFTAVLVTGPASATVFTLNPDGSFNYTHNGSETITDSFTYQPTDLIVGAGNLTTVTITINPVNDAPVAVNDAHSVNEDTPLNVAAPGVLGNDTDAELSGFTAVLDAGPTQALSFTLNANGSFDYVPAANYFGPDSFTYHANDGTANSNIATVTITVNSVNDAPVATNDSYMANKNTVAVPSSLSVPAPGVLANDADPVEGDPLSAVLVSGPSSASSFTLNADGSFTYTPNVGFVGADTFTYTANDASPSNTATVTITVIDNPPVVAGESYETVGNTQLQVSSTETALAPVIFVIGSVLSNDSDPNGDALTATLVSATPGAIVTLNPNGTFTYVPPAGLTTPDTFTYNVSDGTNTVPGTTTISFVGAIWYVKNDAPAGGTGRSADPFDTLVEAETASSTFQTIYIYNGNGTTLGQNAGITLKNGQNLIGSGVALTTFVTVNGVSNEELLPAGTQPMIDHTAGNGVSASNAAVIVRGLNIAGSANAVDVTTSGVINVLARIEFNTIRSAGQEGIDVNAGSSLETMVMFSDNTVTATGNAFDAATSAGAGTMVVRLGNSSFTSAATGISINGVAGGITYIAQFSDMNVSGNTVGNGIDINTATFDAAFNNSFTLVAGNTLSVGSAANRVGASAMRLQNVRGRVSFVAPQLFADNGAALLLTSTGANLPSSTRPFEFTILGPGAANFVATNGAAIDMTGAVLLGGTNVNVTSLNSSGLGVNLNNVDSTALVTINSASSITNASGTDFAITGGNVAVNYQGTITDDVGQLVQIANTPSGAKTFSGSITDLNNGTGNGISLSNNGTSVITFSGGLTLSTGSNPAFAATGAGTLNITGSSNTIVTGSGIALRVENVDIGSSDLTFRSISSNGAANGILLNNTGASGGLFVTGTGAAGTGGTIQNGTIGISLTSTRDIDLAFMQLNGFGDYAIRGIGVVNFNMASVVINGTNGTDAAADEGSVRFTDLTGTASISNSNISGAVENNFRVVNNSGTLNRITFTGTTFGPMSNVTGNDGLVLEALGTAVLNATVQSCTFTHAAGDLFNFLTNGTGANDLIFTGNTLTNAHPAIATGGGGVTISSNGTGNQTLNISSNSFRDADGHAVLIVKSTGGSTTSGTFNNNTIGVAGTANSGSIAGSGLKVQNAGQGTVNLAITNNQIRQYNNFGIEILTGGGAVAQPGSMQTTITGNTVSNPGTGGLPMNGIHLNGGTVPGDTYQICMVIGGAGGLANSITGSGANGGTDFRLRQRQATTVKLPGYAGVNNNDAAVVTFVAGQNGGASGLASNTVPTGGGFIGGAACP